MEISRSLLRILTILLVFSKTGFSTISNNEKSKHYNYSYQTLILHPNQTKVIYFYFNLKGKVYYRISNKSGSNKIICWWVKGPFGAVEGIGTLRNNGNIPFKGLVWGKLKASGADSETKILITDNSAIASNFPSIHF